MLLLAIVQRSSSPELLAVLAGSGVVDQLHSCLQAARNEQDAGWLAGLLAALGRLPMTVDVLRRSSLGRTVNKLAKSLQGPLQEQALALVQQWRVIVSNWHSTKPQTWIAIGLTTINAPLTHKDLQDASVS